MKNLYLFFFSICVLPLTAQQLTDVSPNSGNVHTSLTLTISGSGTNFTQGSQYVLLEQGSVFILAEQPEVISNSIIEADIALTADAFFGQTPTGWYDVVYSDQNMNTLRLPESFYINFPVSVDEKQGVEALNIYPNPATDGRFTIEGVFHNEYELIIMDMTGKVISVETISSQQNRTDVEVSNYSAGTYVVLLQNDRERIARKLILR